MKITNVFDWLYTIITVDINGKQKQFRLGDNSPWEELSKSGKTWKKIIDCEFNDKLTELYDDYEKSSSIYKYFIITITSRSYVPRIYKISQRQKPTIEELKEFGIEISNDDIITIDKVSEELYDVFNNFE